MSKLDKYILKGMLLFAVLDFCDVTYSYLFYCCVIKDTCSNVNHWFSDSAGWPTTQNPPPGFQSTVHSTAQHPEPHKISEGNTYAI